MRYTSRLDGPASAGTVLALVFLTAMVMMCAGGRRQIPRQLTLCGAWYARAKTAVDTSIIDQRIEPTGRGFRSTCGELRRLGKR